MFSLCVSLSSQCMADSGAWQRVNTQVPIRSPRYAVFDLAEGKQYNFRVLSANIYGTSEPSEPTRPIETQQLKGLFLTISFSCHIKYIILEGWIMSTILKTTVFLNHNLFPQFLIYVFITFVVVFRCAISSWSGNFDKGNRHLCPHPVGPAKGTQQFDWLLHRPMCEGVQRLDLSQS